MYETGFFIFVKTDYMKMLLAFTLFFVCLALSCKKDSDLVITGYTPTDNMGNPMGDPDPSDWTFDASWANSELHFFSDIESGDLAGTSPGAIVIHPAYPNPVSGNAISLSMNSDSTCKMRYAMVNKERQIISYDAVSLQQGTNDFLLSIGSGMPAGLYRLYYVFDAEGNYGFLKGHGDVMIP
jgi:hypothetical protein